MDVRPDGGRPEPGRLPPWVGLVIDGIRELALFGSHLADRWPQDWISLRECPSPLIDELANHFRSHRLPWILAHHFPFRV